MRYSAAQYLPFSATDSFVLRVSGNGRAYYVVDAGVKKLVYDGVATPLTMPGSAVLAGIIGNAGGFSEDGTVYVNGSRNAGSTESYAIYWLNGVPSIITGATSPQFGNSVYAQYVSPNGRYVSGMTHKFTSGQYRLYAFIYDIETDTYTEHGGGLVGGNWINYYPPVMDDEGNGSGIYTLHDGVDNHFYLYTWPAGSTPQYEGEAIDGVLFRDINFELPTIEGPYAAFTHDDVEATSPNGRYAIIMPENLDTGGWDTFVYDLQESVVVKAVDGMAGGGYTVTNDGVVYGDYTTDAYTTYRAAYYTPTAAFWTNHLGTQEL